DGLAMLIALWIANTYAFERFHYAGYLAIRSATPQCGKTRLLELISMLAKGTPSITTMPTAAVLFRSTQRVMLFDEVDKLRNSDRETYGDVMAVLNCGFQRGALVQRVDRGKASFPVVSFSVYGPKAFAGIENLTDTLADR